MINIDIAGNISFSSNFDNDVGTDRDTPVVYQICWSSFAPAFNIALLVPKRSINGSHNNCNILANEPSLLSIVENNDSMNFQSSSDRNIDKYILRLPLSCILSLSATLSGGERFLPPELKAHTRISTPWLDRSKLRDQLVKGGCTIDLEFSA